MSKLHNSHVDASLRDVIDIIDIIVIVIDIRAIKSSLETGDCLSSGNGIRATRRISDSLGGEHEI